MKPRGGKPYVYVTWITGLLSGNDKCKWKAWFKAHYKYDKVESEDNGNLAKWIREHDAMTEARVKTLQSLGFTTFVEDANSFKLEGDTATLSGRPDLIAVKDKDVLIVDEKSGKKKADHWWQVAIYMMVARLGRWKGHDIRGEIEYKDEIQPISANDVGPETTGKILEVIRMAANPIQPPATPSPGECRYCDIKACAFRHVSADDSVSAKGLF